MAWREVRPPLDRAFPGVGGHWRGGEGESGTSARQKRGLSVILGAKVTFFPGVTGKPSSVVGGGVRRRRGGESGMGETALGTR